MEDHLKNKAPTHPEALRFIQEVINCKEEGTAFALAPNARESFARMVKQGKLRGYRSTDKELLTTLTSYYDNQVALPHWLERELGKLAIWHAWEDRA